MDRNPSRQVTNLPSWVAIDNDSKDIMVLVCHVILQEHVIKGSSNFIDESCSS